MHSNLFLCPGVKCILEFVYRKTLFRKICIRKGKKLPYKMSCFKKGVGIRCRGDVRLNLTSATGVGRFLSSVTFLRNDFKYFISISTLRPEAQWSFPFLFLKQIVRRRVWNNQLSGKKDE